MGFKKIFLTIGAGIASVCILAACGDGGNNKENMSQDTMTSESSEKTNDNTLQPVTPTSENVASEAETEKATDTSEGETTQNGDSVADVYGDGVDPITAKSSENGLEFLRDNLKSAVGRMCGFAYLGSVKEGVSLKDVIRNSDTADKFRFIKDMDLSKIISDGGNDIFVFVPTDEKSKVQINTFAESDNGKVLYTSEKGTPFFICTKDELNDSMEIVITDSVGNVGHFTPDRTTGSIADLVYKDVTAYNFTTDAVVSADVDQKYMLDTVLMREPSLNDLMAKGTSLSSDSYKRIYIDDLEFYTLDFGHDEGDKHITERLYAVSKDGTLVYRYDPDKKDWMDLLAFDFNAEQYK